MDLDYLKQLDDEALKADIKRLSRSQLDDDFRWLGGQRAQLMQKLEALFADGREDRFIAIRPGGLDAIDAVIAATPQENPKELMLLKSFRDLNRILNVFMDVYEENVLGDLHYISKEELLELYKKVEDQIKLSRELLGNPNTEYRKQQDSSGKLRLAILFRAEILKQLKDRFGHEPDNSEHR